MKTAKTFSYIASLSFSMMILASCGPQFTVRNDNGVHANTTPDSGISRESVNASTIFDEDETPSTAQPQKSPSPAPSPTQATPSQKPDDGTAPAAPVADHDKEKDVTPATPQTPAAPKQEAKNQTPGKNEKSDSTADANVPQNPTLPPVTTGAANTPATQTSTEKNVVEAGVVKPTVYFFPMFNEDKNPCGDGQSTVLHDVDGNKIIDACQKDLDSCGLQGACAIIQDSKRRVFNISQRVSGQDRFFEVTTDTCKYGYGVQNTCLDPFYTVAADLTIYHIGDVIYIPAVRGLVLPSGDKHSGYFIVRDAGRGIQGKGRFDFFSGTYNWMDPKNPFTKIGLADRGTRVPYYRINGSKATQLLQLRGYPKLPAPVVAAPAPPPTAPAPVPAAAAATTK